MQALRDKPYSFDFFQAVRRLECDFPDLPRIGHSQRPQYDPVRFCQNVSLAFTPSSIETYSEATDEYPSRMVVNFFGLLGTNGPLPLPITEYIHDRLQNHKDKTLASFLNVFNHRMISLFYRAWACNQQSVSHDRKEKDPFAVYIGSLFGIGEDSFRNRDAVPDVGKLHYSGRFVCETKNAEGLREILQDYFGITVYIEEFVGQWIKFRIRFGPMHFSEYQRMLPGGDSILRLIAWVKNYIGDELSWEIQLILKAIEVPSTCLGKMGQLGWSTWLRSKKFDKDVGDLVLRNLVA
jgi:type VI secretion system protein ImpH